MSLPPPRLYDPLKDKPLLDQIAVIHADCIINDGQLLTFIPPLNHEKIVNYWLDVSEQVESGKYALVLQMSKSGEDGDEGEVAGVVFLVSSSTETGPFRGDVCKLIVSTQHRRKGVARRLMEKLEEVAREKESYLLVSRLILNAVLRIDHQADELRQMLDTLVGCAADTMYPRLGYKFIGVVPKYGFCPHTGVLVDESFYYKDLRDQK